MVTDPSFGRAVSVLGVHDTCGLPTTGYRCVVAAQARTLAARMAKPLWESELGATPATGTNPALPGPGGLARALNDAYNQAGITGILVWPLIDAIPPDLPHENRGLVLADLPWDGYYYVTPLTWVIAQTTQFTAAGWRHAAGANGDLPAGGSYDTYLAPGRSAWSMVAQTSVATAAQQVTIHVTGGLPARVVHVWSTNLRGPGQFVQRGDIIPHTVPSPHCCNPGTYIRLLRPPGSHGRTATPPPVPDAGPMPVQYTATPDSAGMANMLAPIEGSFGYVHGVLTQTTAGEPVEWQYPGRSPAPYAIVGQNTWRDYTVSARVILPPSGTAVLGARRHAYRTVPWVPGDQRQPVPRLRAEDPQQRRLADRGQRPGSRDARIRKRHRRPRLHPEPHHPWHHHLSTDRRRPRGRRYQSHVPVWTCRAGEPRLLPGALPQLRRPLIHRCRPDPWDLCPEG